MTTEHKIMSLEKLLDCVRHMRLRKDNFVFTNGCFDLLHPGHIALLEKASHFGNRLVVGLNSDVSVQKLKGPSRPIMNQEDRARVLAALQCVDFVTIFDEPDPLNLILAIKPDVLVKGGDWAPPKYIIGSREVESWGGRVIVVPTLETYSTTSILKRLERTPACHRLGSGEMEA